MAQAYTQLGSLLPKVIKGGLVQHFSRQCASTHSAMIAGWQTDTKSANICHYTSSGTGRH